jgi:hypothetical protein
MNALTTPKCFIASGKTHKALTIILHTPQVTQAMSLLESKPKQKNYIGCDQLTRSMAIILFVHALHFGRVMSIQMDGQQFKRTIPIESNRQKLDFL